MKVLNISSLQSVQSWEDLRRFSSQALTNFYQILSRGIGFQDNINCEIVDVVIGLGDTAIPHKLGVVPIGYIVLKATSTIAGYPVTGSSAWTDTEIYLTCNASNSVYTIAIIGS